MTAPQNPPTLSRATLEADVAAVLAGHRVRMRWQRGSQWDDWACSCGLLFAASTSAIAHQAAVIAPILEAHLLAAVAEAETALLARVAPIIEGGAA